jgi:hypothetical protein
MDQDEREKRARTLYERVTDRQPDGARVAWITMRTVTREWWCALVDVIGEIEREAHPLRVVQAGDPITLTEFMGPDAVPMAQPEPLTEAEARAWSLAIWKPQSRGTTTNDLLDDSDRALMALSRGDIPPEVRPLKPEAQPVPKRRCVPLFDGPPRSLYQPNGPDGQPEDDPAQDEPWSPKPGDRVRTAEKLNAHPQTIWSPSRKPNATGEIRQHVTGGDRPRLWVRHDDGTEAPYDEDELRPEPAIVNVADRKPTSAAMGPTLERPAREDPYCVPDATGVIACPSCAEAAARIRRDLAAKGGAS